MEGREDLSLDEGVCWMLWGHAWSGGIMFADVEEP